MAVLQTRTPSIEPIALADVMSSAQVTLNFLGINVETLQHALFIGFAFSQSHLFNLRSIEDVPRLDSLLCQSIFG